MRFAFISTMTGLAVGRKRGTLEPNGCPAQTRWARCAGFGRCTGRDCRTKLLRWQNMASSSKPIHEAAAHAVAQSRLDQALAQQSEKLWPVEAIQSRLSRHFPRAQCRRIRLGESLPRSIDPLRDLSSIAIASIWWFEEKNVEEAVASPTQPRAGSSASPAANLDLLRMQVGEPLLNGEVVWNPYNVSPETAPTWPDENGQWRLACVARMDPAAKGQELLLQTLARPEWRDRPVELNLFGDGPYELTLRRMAGMLQLNHVHFRGHVADIKAIWEQNHLLVLPSRYEGLPLGLGRGDVVRPAGGRDGCCRQRGVMRR